MCAAFTDLNDFGDQGYKYMMDFVRNWLIGITASAIILSLADNLMPDGSVKRIGKLAGGLLLILAILKPVLSLDYEILAGTLANYRYEVQEYSTSLEIENERLKKIIIEDRTGAYIHDRAVELGINCTVSVQCCINENEQLYPASVTVYGEMTQGQIEELMRIIEAEIAIPSEMQRYERKTES